MYTLAVGSAAARMRLEPQKIFPYEAGIFDGRQRRKSQAKARRRSVAYGKKAALTQTLCRRPLKQRVLVNKWKLFFM